MLGHRIISSTKQFGCNLAIVVWFAVTTRWGLIQSNTVLSLLSVGLEEHCRKCATSLASIACRVAELSISLVHRSVLLLVDGLLLAEARIINRLKLTSSLALSSIVHECFDSLLALKTCWLHFIQRRVHDLLVIGLELAEFGQVNFHVRLLAHKFSNQGEDVHQG